MFNLIKYAIKWLKKKYVIAGTPVIIENSNGEILLGKRSGSSIFYDGFWGLPGGIIEYGEIIEDAAVREVMEELGVKIKILKRGGYYEDFPNKECSLHVVSLLVYGKIVEGVPEAKDETSEIKWFKPKEIRTMKLAYNHKKILEREGLI